MSFPSFVSFISCGFVVSCSSRISCAHCQKNGACRSSWSRMGSLKSFTLTIPSNFAKHCEDLSWNHCASTPHRSETNGIAERAVRRVKEGTSAVLLQSSLVENWWVHSMESHTYLRNIQDLLSDGKTPHERRFGKDQSFRLVHWLSITLFLRKTSQESINFVRKVLLGLFLGFVLRELGRVT